LDSPLQRWCICVDRKPKFSYTISDTRNPDDIVYENLGFRSTQMYQLCKGLSNDYSCIVLILSGFLVSDIVYENLGFRSTQMYQLCKGYICVDRKPKFSYTISDTRNPDRIKTIHE
jgi:hypothetical protein